MISVSYRAALAAALLLGAAHMAGAQSLGDLARAREGRQTSGTKTYTNADLGEPGVTTEAPKPAEPAAAAPVTPARDAHRPAVVVEENPKTGRVNVSVKAEDKPDEAYWRRTVHDLRVRLAQAKTDVAATESALAALPAGAASDTRQSTAAVLARQRNDVRLLSEELTRLLARAQSANVPAEWVR